MLIETECDYVGMIDLKWNRAATDTHKICCRFGRLFRSTTVTYVFSGCLHSMGRIDKQVAGNVAVSQISK
jgi:hypothetical protein